jgi:hypothetical protein
MKKNKIIQGILLIAIVINYGCETDANVIVPAGERKLVVGGFLSPTENEHQISLSQTDPLFSTDTPISLANVKLTISSDSSSYSPSYDFNSGTFQFNNNQFKIENDKNYHLKIVTEDGKIVESDMRTLSNQMPLVTDLKLNIDTVYTDFMYPELQYSLKISWNDLIGEQNYYRLIANRLLKDFDSNDTIVEPLNYFNEYELKDDKGKDGQVLTANFKYIESGAMNSPIGFEIILMKVDVNYYNYYKTLNNYADGDPFAEPVILFSNIQNGLGVFCNFQTEKRRVFLFF